MRIQKKNQDSRFPDVLLLDAGGGVLFDGPLNKLCFSEKLIVAKSIQFFHDEEPCFIHRSAVAVRLISELDLLLKESDALSIEQVEESCPEYLGEYGEVKYMRLKRENTP
jgi:hypothetical protein